MTNTTQTEEFSNIDDVINLGGSSARQITVLQGHNLGSNTLLISLPIHEFYERSQVANERNIEDSSNLHTQPVAQRKLDPTHAKGLAKYMLKGFVQATVDFYQRRGDETPAKLLEIQKNLGKQPYLAMQPLTVNIRACEKGGRDLKFKRSDDGKITLFLGDHHVLWVVDGQHRRHAIQLLLEYLKDLISDYTYPKRNPLYEAATKGSDVDKSELVIWQKVYEIARSNCTVMLEVHLGLNAAEERQLFHDLNNLSKKIEAGLAFSFDSSNPVNIFIKEELIENCVLSATVIDKDKNEWKEDEGVISRKDLIAVNAILFLNKTNIKGATPQKVDEASDIAVRFWEQVSQIPNFGQEKAKTKTVAAQPVVLKAIAKMVYTYAFSRNPDRNSLAQLLNGIPELDFSHTNPMWRYYLFAEDERDRRFPGLRDYLPSDDVGANRDIGTFDNVAEWFRFGAKHNDIFPIIGDMIRWSLRLPNRHKDN